VKNPALNRLKELDSQSIGFYEANQTMLREGYSEADILDGLYRFSYDGKPDKLIHPDPMKEYLKKHPQEAQKLADELLKLHDNDRHYKDAGLMAANYIASRNAPGMHAKSFYAQRFADSVGIPYFSTLFVILLTLFIVVKYDLPIILLYIVPLIFIGFFAALNYLRDKH
jgi:hypothetical protein